MTALLERFERQATILDRQGPRPKRQRVISDLSELMALQAQEWTVRDRRLKAAGVPTAAIGYAAPVIPNAEPAVAPAAVTGVTVETALYGAALYSPLPAGTLRAPQTLTLYMSGTVTSSGAGQTIIVTPRIGTSTGGATLGASSAMALGSTITNALWDAEINITIRSVGSGTGASAYATSEFRFGTTAGASATVTTALFGNSVATFDSTVAQGVFIGVTPSATGVSIQAQQIRLVAWD